MGFLVGLFVLVCISIIFKNASSSWSRALEPGNKIRAERKRAKQESK